MLVDERVKVYSYNSYGESKILRVRLQKKNKKVHSCMYCNNTIMMGDGSAYYSGLDLGRFYSYHICMGCYDNTKEGGVT